MEICQHDSCTGCFACENICPKRCISMVPDSLGALHPVIDQDNCIECLLCKNTCPNNRIIEYSNPIECYAGWRTDKDKRKFSASGGIGAVLSEHVISNGGVVVGTSYDDNIVPVTTVAYDFDGIEKFKGSKYVQSLIGKSFSQIRDLLTMGKQILYIATPCQISGLLSFLKKPYDNLITVDLICHGVCPTSYFTDEITHLSNKKHIANISNVTFRGNIREKFNFQLNFSLTIFDGQRVVFNRPAMQEYYFAGFLKGITLRENCYKCQYARPERVSDITIGDFIGIGKDYPFDGPENVSIITANSKKGSQFIQNVQKECGETLKLEERQYSEAIKYGPSLCAPFPRHELTDRFQALYPRLGFIKTIRRLLFRSVVSDRVHFWYRLLCIAAPKKLYRIITSRICR
ncbi:4Fe-4S dicluster domain-containing protein [Alistipes sp. Z76]|nr:4Fe-4S dicluster domain-containing protein [Alistipes sp. Z76]NCE71143.1 4Fe-4S dicluster domain-containing protein [Muribaculaceae bacterium M3]